MAAVLCSGGVALEMARGGWIGLGILRLSTSWDLGLLLLEAWEWELVQEERIGDDWFMGGMFGLLVGQVKLGGVVWRFAGGVG